MSLNLNKDFIFIAGPCVLENRDTSFYIAEELLKTLENLKNKAKVNFIFKGSFDKANRSDINSFRGIGLNEGLKILEDIKREFSCAVTTDVHLPEQVNAVADVVDLLQIPAFLCRQTDLLLTSAQTGKPVNVKKGQFMAPQDMGSVIGKIRTKGQQEVLITERGTSFGYKNVIVDMSSFKYIKKNFQARTIFDASHSAPSFPDKRDYIPSMACAAAATGCLDGLFLEVYKEPDKALCDGATSLYLKDVPGLMNKLLQIWSVS